MKAQELAAVVTGLKADNSSAQPAGQEVPEGTTPSLAVRSDVLFNTEQVSLGEIVHILDD